MAGLHLRSVHADVHAARFVTVGATTELWIGCDGGVFRSQRGGDDNRLIRNSFLARNTGIASLEAGYTTTHPQVDGYVLAGTGGAAAATLGIFLPAFAFVAISGPLVPRLRASVVAGAMLDGVNVASLALMALVTLHLGRAALVDATTIVIALASAVALVRFHVNTAWLVIAGGVVGAVLVR